MHTQTLIQTDQDICINAHLDAPIHIHMTKHIQRLTLTHIYLPKPIFLNIMHVHSLFQISMPIFVVRGASQSHASSLSQVHTHAHSLLPPLCLVPLSYLFQFSKCATLLLQTTSFHLPGCFSFYLGVRVISSQCLSQFPGPCGSLLPVLPDPFPIHSMTASMTFYDYSTRDMFPAVSPKPKKHLVCSRCTSIFIQGINQLKFWVTTSIANEPQQQGLNPLP